MGKELGILVLLGINAWTDVRKREISLPGILLFATAAFLWRTGKEETGIIMIYPLLPGLLLAAVSVLTEGAVGMGDAILLCALGTALDMGEMLRLLCISALLCGGASLAMLCRGKNRKESIPFVPFLLLGYVGGMLL